MAPIRYYLLRAHIVCLWPLYLNGHPLVTLEQSTWVINQPSDFTKCIEHFSINTVTYQIACLNQTLNKRCHVQATVTFTVFLFYKGWTNWFHLNKIIFCDFVAFDCNISSEIFMKASLWMFFSGNPDYRTFAAEHITFS